MPYFQIILSLFLNVLTSELQKERKRGRKIKISSICCLILQPLWLVLGPAETRSQELHWIAYVVGRVQTVGLSSALLPWSLAGRSVRNGASRTQNSTYMGWFYPPHCSASSSETININFSHH